MTAELDEYWIDEDAALSVGAHEVVARGDQWEFFDDIVRGGAGYPDANQPADWNDPAYDTANPEYGNWEAGSALFAYGALTAGATSTDLDGPAGTYTTYLFRTSFTLDAELAQATEALVDYVFDDGAVVYVNGHEVLRVNMGDGAVNAESFALTTGVEEAYTQTTVPLGDAALVEGENTLAVEVHQVSTTSSDAGMDMSLRIETSGSVLDNDTTDVADPTLTAQLVTSPNHGELVSFNENGSFQYRPDAGYSGVDTFTYRASNSSFQTDTATVRINIATIDDPPVAGDDAYHVPEDGRLVVDATVAQDPTVLIERGSAWFYQDGIKNENFSGGPYDYPTDAAGRAWNDPEFDTNTSYDRTRTPAVSLPWGWGGALLAAGTIEGGATVTPLEGLGDGSGGNNSVTTYLFRHRFQVSQPDDVYRLTLDYLIDDGAIVYLNGHEIYRRSINAVGTTEYATASGNESEFLEETVELPPGILVPGNNTLAVEVHQSSATSSDIGFDLELTAVSTTVVSSVGLLANDFDEEGAPITSIDLAPHSGPTGGTLELSAAMDGSFIYTPRTDFWGDDSFWYTITAGGLTSAPARVDIGVPGRADPPVGVGDEYSVESGETLRADAAFYQNASAQGAVLLARGADWFFSDGGSDQDAVNPAWKAGPETPFDPATATGWHADAAPAKFGFGGAVGDSVATEVQSGPVTHYFRTTFDVADRTQLSQLLIHLMRDDGAAVYINGVEVARQNLAVGADFLQLAPQVPLDAQTYYPTLVDLNALPGGSPIRTGENVVAVEVHQATLDDTDMRFDLELTVPSGPLGVLANDLDPDLLLVEGLAATIDVPPSVGTLSLQNNGTFNYTPPPGYSGAANFTYTTSDGTFTSQPTQVTINVLAPNAVPLAIGEQYATDEGATLDVSVAEGVLVNDTDPEDDPLTGVLVRPTTGGHLTFPGDGSFTYVPEGDFFGTDTFIYRAYDGHHLSEPATVSIVVAGSDDPPTAVDDAYRTNRNVPLVVGWPTLSGVMANDIEPDGQPTTATLATDVAHGTLEFSSDGTFTYTPANDFVGDDTFTYTISDGTTESNVATVTITVDEAPVAVDDSYQVDEDTTLAVAALQGVLANDTDLEGDPLTAVLIAGPSDGTLELAGDGSFTYEPNPDFFGADSFTYRADDGTAQSELASATIAVVPIDDAPVAVDDEFTTDEDNTLSIVDPAAGILANDEEVDGDPLTVTLVADVQHGQLTLDADGTFTYEPDEHFRGTDAFSYVLSDGVGSSGLARVTIDVRSVNDAPVATDDQYEVDEGSVLVVDAGITAQTTAANFIGLAETQTLVTTADVTKMEFSPQFNMLFVRDGYDRVLVIDTLSGEVISVEDAIEPMRDMDLTYDGDFLYVSGFGGQHTSGLPVRPNWVHRFDVAARSWERKLAPKIAYRIEAVDGDRVLLHEEDQWVATTLNHFGATPNDPIDELARLRYGYYGDIEYDHLTGRVYHGNSFSSSHEIIVIQVVGDSLVSVQSTGTYGTAQGYRGSSVLSTGGEHFYYGRLQTEAANVRNNLNVMPESIRVASGNIAFGAEQFYNALTTAPLGDLGFDTGVYAASDDGLWVWAYDGDDSGGTLHRYRVPVYGQGVLANDVDPDDDRLSAVLVGPPSHGSLALDENGGFVYSPERAFSGVDTFTYLASDSTGLSDVATVSIQVNHIGPVTTEDAYALDEDDSILISADAGVLANDVDSMGHPMTAVLVDPPAVGQLDLASDGGFEFTPPADFFGDVTFTYAADDGTLQSVPTTVTITVRPVSDVPVAVDDHFIMDKGTVLRVGRADPQPEPFAETRFTEPVTGVRSFVSAGGELGFTYQLAGTPADDTGVTEENEYLVHGSDVNPETITFETVDLGGFSDLGFSIDARSWEDSDGSDFEEEDRLRVVLQLVAPGGATTELVVVDRSGENLKALDRGQYGSFATFSVAVPDGYVSAAPVVTVTVNSGSERVFIDNLQFTGTSDDAAAGVLLNDVDVDGDLLTAALVEGPTHGTLVLNDNGSFEYTPPTLYVGADTFTYRADDGTTPSNLATVTIDVMEANVVPEANDDAFTTAEDIPLAVAGYEGVLANDVDFDGGRLTALLATGTTHGTLTLAGDGSIYYVPDAEFSGIDTFTYQAHDGRDGSNVAMVTITVDPLNDPPTAVDDVYNIAPGETLEVTPGGLGTDTYREVILNDAPIGYWRLGEPSTSQQAEDLAGGHHGTYVGGVTVDQPGVLAGDDDTSADFDGASGYVDVGTSSDFRLVPGFTIEAWIRPDDVEDWYRIVGKSDDSTGEGYSFTIRNSGQLCFTVYGWLDYRTSSNVVEANRWSHVAVVLDEQSDMRFYIDGELIGSQDGDFPYPSDSGGLFIGAIDRANQIGGLQYFDGLIDEVAVFDRDLSAAEVRAHYLTGMGQPVGETVSLVAAGSDWRYLDDGSNQQTAWRAASFPGESTWQSGPAPLGYGDEWIETTVSYGSDTNDKHVTTYFRHTFTVDSGNDFVGATLGLMRDDAAAVYLNGTEVARDDSLAPLATYDTFAGETAGGTDETTFFEFFVDPNLLVEGENVLAVEVHQALSTSSDLGFDLWLDATLPEEPENPGVLSNDSDPEGIALSAQLVTQPLHGTIEFPGDGSFTYTPDGGFTGTDRFVYRAVDQQGADDLAAVTINIGSGMQAPVGADDYYFARAGRALTVDADAGVLANDVDPNGADLSALLRTDVEHGTLSLDPGGGFTYEPDDGFVGIDRFEYRVYKGTPLLEYAWATINVLGRFDPMNGLPTAADDAFGTSADTVLNVDAAAGVLSNDVDPEQLPLVAVLVEPPKLGTIALAGDGSFVYTPIAQATGVDVFTYRVSDGNTFSQVATVTIDVTPPPAVIGMYTLYPGDEVAANKTALLPASERTHAGGEGGAASLSASSPVATAIPANYTNYVGGLVAVAIDVAGLAGPATVDDFVFRAGNNNEPSDWPAAPPPESVENLPGQGAQGTDRIVVRWSEGAIRNQWLQTTLLASLRTGLSNDVTFYYGNAVAETGNDPTNALVTAADVIAIRDHRRGAGNRVDVTNPYDINRDRSVDALDVVLARNHVTGPFGALRLIAPLPSSGPSEAEGEQALQVKRIDSAVTRTVVFSGKSVFETGDPIVVDQPHRWQLSRSIMQDHSDSVLPRLHLSPSPIEALATALGRESAAKPPAHEFAGLDDALADLLSIAWR